MQEAVSVPDTGNRILSLCLLCSDQIGFLVRRTGWLNKLQLIQITEHTFLGTLPWHCKLFTLIAKRPTVKTFISIPPLEPLLRMLLGMVSVHLHLGLHFQEHETGWGKKFRDSKTCSDLEIWNLIISEKHNRIRHNYTQKYSKMLLILRLINVGV